MSGCDGHFLRGQIAFDDMQVGTADTATMNFEANLAFAGRWYRNIDQPQRRGLDSADALQEHRFH
jgi:hypothetical protein